MEFGVYSDTPTVLHRASPALKIALCLVFLVSVALCNTPITLAAAAAVTMALLAACKVRPKTAAKILKPMAPLMIFVAVLDVVLAIAGAAPASPADAAQAACTGTAQAAESVIKFSCAMLGAAMLMRTTTPGQLARGLATLLAPLRRLGVRTQSVTFALQVTLQFVPILLQEFKEIKQAQTERGAFATTAPARPAKRPSRLRSLLAQVKAYIPVIVPVFDSALRRADTLAQAAHNRGF